MNGDAALSFLDFVAARHEVFTARQLGQPQPWTDNPIVASRKFTNVFRVLDYGSQFVLTDLVDPDIEPEDQLMRLFLYRHTGRVEVWQFLELMLGRYPLRGDLDDVLEIFKQYRGDAHVRTRTSDPRNASRKTQTDFKRSVFTSAYLVFPQSQVPGTDKLESIVDLTKRLFTSGTRTSYDFLNAPNQSERFESLRRNKGVANFMSMQILTDWGYTPHCGQYRENDFIIAGPGAEKGAAALGMKAPDAIRWAHENIQEHRIVTGDGHFEFHRPPSWMDAQNCLCEFSKYVRYEQKPVPGKLYTPAHPGPQQIVLPEHW